jgi:hypothetical protein
MPTIKLDKKKNPPGRPAAEIDWNMVDQLLEAGCSGAQVAGFLGICCSTMYERCKTDKCVQFSEYSQRFNTKGEALLVKAQYDKAIGKSDLGDNTLLIWLGKTRLKQKEHEDQVITKEVEAKFDQLMKQMQKDKENNPPINDSGSTIPETT